MKLAPIIHIDPEDTKKILYNNPLQTVFLSCGNTGVSLLKNDKMISINNDPINIPFPFS